MTEHGLDKAHVGTVLQHQRGHGVAKQMATATLADVGFFDVLAYQLGQPVGAEGFALLGQKQGAIVQAQNKMRPDVVAVFGDPRQRPLADGDHPILLALALADHHRAALVIDGAPAQADQFHAAHAGRVEGFQHGAVADAGGSRHVRHVQNALGLVAAEDVFRQALLHPRQVEVGRWVVEDAVGFGQPLKPHPDRRDAHRLAPGG
ncbi:hypothetical protein D9M70_537370 [compost metagenome]